MRRKTACPHWDDSKHLDYIVWRRATQDELNAKYGLLPWDIAEGILLGEYEAGYCPGCAAADIATLPA